MKLRRYLMVGTGVLVLTTSSASWAAPSTVAAAAPPPSVVVAPNNVPRAAAPTRVVPAAALVDQSSVEEAQQVNGAVVPAPVVAGQAEEQPAAIAEPTAQEPKRSWLRQPRNAEPEKAEPASSSDWSLSVLALVLLGGLAGAAVVMKLRRGAPAPWLPPAAVRVLSTTRLTPKASLITAEVHGRVLLLGVTDESVTELGWLDGNPGAESSLKSGERELDEDDGVPLAPNAANSRAGFGQVLGSVFRASQPKAKETEFRGNPNVAALIAARDTRDVVSTNYSRATAGAERRSSGPRAETDAPQVETQVAGLARRRR